MTDIAVVIPCFNLGRTVEEAVDSVAAQTRPAAEIVVVDDGSTDLHTRQRLASLSRPRLRVVRVEHRGASGARNHGAALTSAPYLVFLDADDALEPTYLERTGACLDGTPELDFVSTAMRGFGEATYVWTPPPPDLMIALTRGTIPITALLRRAVWETVGGFDEALPISEDRDFWITALERGYRGHIIDDPLLRRRVRWDSLHHAAVSRGTHREVGAIVLSKHRAAIKQLGPDLLLAKEAFIVEQQADRGRLQQRADDLHVELGRLNREIALCRLRLREHEGPLIDLAELPRVEPVSPVWGLDRGKPVDRYYIESFLASHRADIQGRVLEIKDAYYAETYGSPAVTAREVLDVVANNPRATIVADLTRADAVPSASFDCFILTQTLHIIRDVQAALFHAHRILAPGGVLLATLPAVSRINYEDGGLDAGDYWRFTETGVRRLFGGMFDPDNVDVLARGNLKACVAFLYGLATDDLLTAELDQSDPRCPLVFCVRAVKAPVPAPAVPRRVRPAAAILMYHRIAKAAADPHGLCVSPEEFRAQMQFLIERHPLLPLEELAAHVVSGEVPDGVFAITLDDGTIDALEVASPILGELGVPATFFVNTERLDIEHEAWWDVLSRIFLGDAPVPPAIEVTLGGNDLDFSTRNAKARLAAYRAIHHWLLRATLPERERILADVVRWSGMALPPRHTHRLLVGDEMRRLAERPGHTIGSHSRHHLLLPRQPGDEWIHEILGSKTDLERLLDCPVSLFSYPYGGHDRDTAEQVRAAGFLAAVTTKPGSVSEQADVFALPRHEPKGAGLAAFAQLVRGALAGGPK